MTVSNANKEVQAINKDSASLNARINEFNEWNKQIKPK